MAAHGAVVTEKVLYATIAAAEKAITDAGYTRDVQRALWVNTAGKTAKVKYADPGTVMVEWS